MIPAIIIVISIGLFLTIQYSLFIPPARGLPVLMYHKVSPDVNNHLTITDKNLEKHFAYLSDHGYTCLPLSEVLVLKDLKLPRRHFVLTFDDAYLNNLEYVYPLLQKFNFHASIMLPVGYLGKVNEWDNGVEPLMNYDQLLSMDSRYVSFGLHTYGHISLKSTPSPGIVADLEKCKQELNRNGIEYLPVLAYPYGSYPRRAGEKDEFFRLLEGLDIALGLRIGNRINRWPFKQKFEIKRIDIKGDDTFWMFKTKLKKGRVRMF